MKQQRTNTTSFRYSDEVKEIISNTPGASFADKIEHICLDYIKSYDARISQIDSLDKQIKRQKEEINNLVNKARKMGSLIDKVKRVEFLMDEMVKDCNTK